MNFKYLFYIIFFAVLLGPLWVLVSGQVDFHLDWRTASRNSAELAPSPKSAKEAIIQVYSARAFDWRGIFGVHTWIAVKPKAAPSYTVYQVLGWELLNGKSALVKQTDIPDRYWFGQKPEIILDIRGEKAEKLIPLIAKAVESYPYPNQYEVWPGPNSNTFVAHVARAVLELQLELPSTAIGKDYLSNSTFFAHAPSGTGYQISLWGILGVIIAKREGLEINFLGLVLGISPWDLSIKIPGVGEVGL